MHLQQFVCHIWRAVQTANRYEELRSLLLPMHDDKKSQQVGKRGLRETREVPGTRVTKWSGLGLGLRLVRAGGGRDSHVNELEMGVVDTRLQQRQRHGLAVERHVPNLPQLYNARSKCCGVESGCFGKRMAHAVFLNRLQKQERVVCFAVDREEFKVLSVRLKRIAKRVGEQVSDLCGPLHHERGDGATSHEDVGHNAPVNACCGVACRWGGKTADGG